MKEDMEKKVIMKTGRKRFLAVILVFCMTLSVLMETADAVSGDTINQCGVNAMGTLNSSGTLTISGTGPMKNYDVITNWSPWHMGSARAVKIEEGITTIGSAAFGWMFSLKTVEIPKSVIIIGSDAFNNSRMITDIYYAGTEEDWNNIAIGSGNYTLNSAAIHYGTKGSSKEGTCGDALNWTLSDDGVLTISGTGEMDDFTGGGNGTAPWYSNREKIKKVIIEEGVTRIGYCAFWECTKIEAIILPNTLTEIGGFSIALCTSLREITIPDSVTQIDFSAFGACYSLSTLEIPEGVTKIEGQTFTECKGLRTITIPSGITEIGDTAFSKCPNLADVYYGGSESEWNAIAIGSDNDALRNATIHFGAPYSDEDSGYSIQRKTIKFNNDRNVDLDWGWSLFDREASEYSHDLAMAALVLSMATEQSESEAKARMETLGFEYVETVDYDSFLNNFAPAAVFGAKKVTFADGTEKYIIVMNVRGTTDFGDFLTDGASQFNGFFFTGWRKMVQLCDYISYVEEQYKGIITSDNMILFISGHSLGGAAAGLQAELMSGSTEQEHMFIYTFASPNYDTLDKDIASYTNVHNIINTWDVIPNLPIGYKRYGHDWYYNSAYCTKEIEEVYGSLWNYYWGWVSNLIDIVPVLKFHYLETYLACMLSGVPSNMGDGVVSPYTLASIHCPVDIEMLDSDGNVIGWTEGETVHNPDRDNVLIMTDGDAKYVWSPTDKQYTIRFTATDNGTMTFTQQTFDLSGEVIDEKVFQDVSLTSKKTMTADIGGDITPSGTRLFVVGTDDETKTAEVQEDGTEFLLKGDINKDFRINLADAQLCLKAALNLTTLSQEQRSYADVDRNGVINLWDAQLILKAALNMIVLE